MKSIRYFLAVMLTLLLLAVPLGTALQPMQLHPQPLQLFDNNPPNPPTLSGPHAGAMGFDLVFKANATDPDGDPVFFKIDWGDGNVTDWLGPANVSENIITHYSWYTEGNYTIHIKDKDLHGAERNDSVAYNITIGPQLSVTNLAPGYVYMGQSFFFIGMLYLVSGVVVMTTGTSLVVNATGTANVAKITAIVTSVTKGTSFNTTDDSASDGFHFNLSMKSGLYSLLLIAYDANNNMIDGFLFNFVLYFQFGTMTAANRLLIQPHFARQNV